MFTNNGRGYVQRPVNKRFDPRYTVSTEKFGGGNLMLWGCFSWLGVNPLHLIDGIMDRFMYRDILNSIMQPYAQENMHGEWLFHRS